MIQLQFSRQADICSDAIAWFTQGALSHVDCVLPSGLLLGARSDSIGGQPPGVQARPAHYAKWALTVRFTIPTTAAQAEKFYKFLYDQLGKPYDHSAIWGFVSGREWRAADSWICSELQAAAMEASGIVQPLYLNANKITPTSLALLASGISGSQWVPDERGIGSG